jgi:uncharacterized protein (DUF3820 family)
VSVEKYVCPFGQHIGRPISDVPTEYLKWVVQNLEDVKGSTVSVLEFVAEAELELEERGEDYD